MIINGGADPRRHADRPGAAYDQWKFSNRLRPKTPRSLWDRPYPLRRLPTIPHSEVMKWRSAWSCQTM